ncbi:hypothetical protein PE36_03761 [Moritella sp. PE36]|nr:hypothetical protein PE36_03761 [Moritella sp. PE36]
MTNIFFDELILVINVRMSVWWFQFEHLCFLKRYFYHYKVLIFAKTL